MANVFNRKIIDSSIYIPYGLEIEMENIDYIEAKRLLEHKIDRNWNIATDISLNNGGLELASQVLPNNKETIIQLKKISKTLEFINPTFDNASFQINYDVDYLSSDDILYLLKIFSIYENIIYRFSTGVNDKIRPSAIYYAKPIKVLFKEKYDMHEQKEDSYIQLKNNKFFALSLKTLTKDIKNPIRVIEFRTPNGTTNFYLWMNYIVFFSSFLMTIKNKNYDAEYINYLFDKLNFSSSIDELMKIDEFHAIEFANLIYQNEAEKEHFYSQYFDKKIRTR